MKIKLVMQQEWASLPDKISEVKNRILAAKNAYVEIEPVLHPFSSIPFVDDGIYFDKPSYKVDPDWLRQNLLPLKEDADVVALVIPFVMWQGGGQVGHTEWLAPETYAITIQANEDQEWPDPQMSWFTNNLIHEFTHFLKQRNHLSDDTHSYLLYNKFDLKGALTNVPMNQTKIVVSKDGKTVYKCVPVAIDWNAFVAQSNVEGITIPNPIPPASSL
jgi:hypothetical protein